MKLGGIILSFTRKKVFVFISMLLVSLLILSGCGGGSDLVTTEETTSAALSTVNNFVSGFNQEDLNKIKQSIDNESFKYIFEDGDQDNSSGFFNALEQEFSDESTYATIELKNITTEIMASDQVKITALMIVSGLNVDSNQYSNH